jgi:Flp pilus assembly pilin Flp
MLAASRALPGLCRSGPMFRTSGRIKSLLSDTEGVTLIEYCLVAVLIAVASLVIVTAVGTEVLSIYSRINSALSSSAS